MTMAVDYDDDDGSILNFQFSILMESRGLIRLNLCNLCNL